MEHIDHELKIILIRWHGLRQYQGSEIVGMRGFPQWDFGGSERYELAYHYGQWRCDYFVRDKGMGIGYDPVFKLIAEDANLYVVIKACEEHAYSIYQTYQNARDEEYEDD